MAVWEDCFVVVGDMRFTECLLHSIIALKGIHMLICLAWEIPSGSVLEVYVVPA